MESLRYAIAAVVVLLILAAVWYYRAKLRSMVDGFTPRKRAVDNGYRAGAVLRRANYAENQALTCDLRNSDPDRACDVAPALLEDRKGRITLADLRRAEREAYAPPLPRDETVESTLMNGVVDAKSRASQRAWSQEVMPFSMGGARTVDTADDLAVSSLDYRGLRLASGAPGQSPNAREITEVDGRQVAQFGNAATIRRCRD